MNEFQLNLTAEERAFLAELLERTLESMRVEEHRTRAPSYRETVLRDEKVLTSLIEKLGKPAFATV
jgi:hypothetical protein